MTVSYATLGQRLCCRFRVSLVESLNFLSNSHGPVPCHSTIQMWSPCWDGAAAPCLSYTRGTPNCHPGPCPHVMPRRLVGDSQISCRRFTNAPSLSSSPREGQGYMAEGKS